MTTNSQKLTITLTQPPTLSTVIAVVPTEPDQIGDVIARTSRRAESLSHSEGFIGTAIHHSLDGERVLEYSQWLSASSWREATQRWSKREGDDAGRSDVRLYEVVLVFSASGSNMLEITEPSGVIAMINVLSTDSGRKDQLMDVWRRGAERFWEKQEYRMTRGGRCVSPRLMSRWGKMLESMRDKSAPTAVSIRLSKCIICEASSRTG